MFHKDSHHLNQPFEYSPTHTPSTLTMRSTAVLSAPTSTALTVKVSTALMPKLLGIVFTRGSSLVLPSKPDSVRYTRPSNVGGVDHNLQVKEAG